MLHYRRWTLALSGCCLFLATQQAVANNKTTAAVLDETALATRIDQLIAERTTEKGVTPAPLADDAEFLRRVHLDLIGRIPRVSEVRDFLDDKTADKRRRVVDRLLDSPQHVKHFAATWQATVLAGGNSQQQFANNPTFRAWMETQVRDNVPYDKMVRALITAGVGAPAGDPRFVQLQGRVVQPQQATPIAFVQVNEFKPENMAASTSRIFLGVRLECAQCHDHPFTSWKRKQFWEFAAFFAGVQNNNGRRVILDDNGVARLVQDKPAATFPRTIKMPGMDEKVVEARYLDTAVPEWKDKVDSRVTLADWVTSANNPYFAQTGANRLWAHLFGLGINDPVDDEPGDDTPISHPALLKELTGQFVAHKFDVKFLLRAIMASKTYQRTSAKTHASQGDPRLFSRMALKGLTPTQLFDSLVEATGYREGQQAPVRGGFGGGSPRGEFLARFASTDKRTEMQTSILQALALMNGKFVADATSVERSNTLAAVADAPFMKNAQKVETLFLATLSRLPRPDEAERLNSYVDNGGTTGDERVALADVFWALLNSSEFILNH